MSDERTSGALGEFEDAVNLLWLVASSPPDVEPRPPWWRPLARYRHLVEHDAALAVWAEAVEMFAEDLDGAARVLDVARRRNYLDDALDGRG